MDTGLKVIRINTVLQSLKTKGHLFVVSSFTRKLLALISIWQYIIAVLFFVVVNQPKFISVHYVKDLPLGYFASILCGARLIYLPHELETERTGLSGIRKKYDQLIESIFIRPVAHTVVVCDPIAEWYRNRYSLNNIHVVRNAPERLSVERNRGENACFRHRFSIPESAVVFIYQGMFGAGRGTDQLIDIFEKLDHKSAHLVLMGFGSASMIQRISTSVCKNIHFQPSVPRDLIFSYTSGADVGLIFSEANSLSYQLSLPNKYFEYIHAGIPVIVSDNLTYLASIIAQHQIGWSVKFESLHSFVSSFSLDDRAALKSRISECCMHAYWEQDAAIYHSIYSLSHFQDS